MNETDFRQGCLPLDGEGSHPGRVSNPPHFDSHGVIGSPEASISVGRRRRMRDRLLEAGHAGLSDRELLELLLHSSMPRRDCGPVARALFIRFGGIAEVVAASPAELLAVKGLGEAGMVALKVARAVAIRIARIQVAAHPVLGDMAVLKIYLGSMLSLEKIERLHILFLDVRNRLIADEAQACGTVDHAPVYPREVVKRALELNASAILLVHNHPSGDPSPSADDIAMTYEVDNAARSLSIHLHDHIVVGKGVFFSFREEGLLGRRGPGKAIPTVDLWSSGDGHGEEPF